MKKTKSKDILKDIEDLKKALEDQKKLSKEIKVIKEKLLAFAGNEDGINANGKWLVEIKREIQKRLDQALLLDANLNPDDYKKEMEVIKVMTPKLIK